MQIGVPDLARCNPDSNQVCSEKYCTSQHVQRSIILLWSRWPATAEYCIAQCVSSQATPARYSIPWVHDFPRVSFFDFPRVFAAVCRTVLLDYTCDVMPGFHPGSSRRHPSRLKTHRKDAQDASQGACQGLPSCRLLLPCVVLWPSSVIMAQITT